MPFLRGALLKNKKNIEAEEEILQPVASAPVPVIPDNIDEIIEESEPEPEKIEKEEELEQEKNSDSETQNETETQEIKIETEAEEPQIEIEFKSEGTQTLAENALPEEIPQIESTSELTPEESENQEKIQEEIQEESFAAPVAEEEIHEENVQIEEQPEISQENQEQESQDEIEPEKLEESHEIENDEAGNENEIANENVETEASQETPGTEEATSKTETTEESADTDTETEATVEEEVQSSSSENVELKYDFDSNERYVDKVSTKTEFDKMLDELANISKDLLSWEVEKFAKKYTGKFQGEFEKTEADAKKYEAFLGGYITNAAMTLYDNGYRDSAIKQLEQAKNILLARQKLEVETEAIKERVEEENAAVDLSDILGMFGDG